MVCGAANNQLAHPGVEKDLADRGILYAPDYLVNSGGVIQVADEIDGFDFERAKNKATKIFDTTLEIFARAAVRRRAAGRGRRPPRRAADARSRAGCARSCCRAPAGAAPAAARTTPADTPTRRLRVADVERGFSRLSPERAIQRPDGG